MIFKRCKGHDPTKCRHPFWYVFELRGKRYRKSTRTADRRIAERIEGRRRGAILDNRDEEDKPKVSLKKHIADYVAYTAKKNRTAYKDEAVLGRLLASVGDRPLPEV